MISVRVPATSANLGPGFDCLGMALGIYNTFEISTNTDRLSIEADGINNNLYCNEDNLVYKSMKRLYREAGEQIPPLKIIEKIGIPISRGLGSSASCIIGGLLAANEMLKKPFNKDKLLKIAADIEGHPDNVAPALLGGFVVSSSTSDGIKCIKHEISRKLKFIVMIPDFTLSTEKARSVLPSSISRADGVFNISRACMLVSCLVTGDMENIKYAVQDRLHQPYRLKLIPGGEAIFNNAYELGCKAIFLSGSGPTLMGIVDSHEAIENMKRFCSSLEASWDIRIIDTDNLGAVVKII